MGGERISVEGRESMGRGKRVSVRGERESGESECGERESESGERECGERECVEKVSVGRESVWRGRESKCEGREIVSVRGERE